MICHAYPSGELWGDRKGSTESVMYAARAAAECGTDIVKTWYTGSAGWMNYLILEAILGMKLEADKLRLAPCIPAAWDGFSIVYRHHSSIYKINVIQPVFSKGETKTNIAKAMIVA